MLAVNNWNFSSQGLNKDLGVCKMLSLLALKARATVGLDLCCDTQVYVSHSVTPGLSLQPLATDPG